MKNRNEKSQSLQPVDGILSHPTTLRLFFYCKKHPEKVNIRQAQRDLYIKRTSTLSWHLEKLAENGLMEQLPDNSYQLTTSGRELSSMQVPLQQVVYFIGNNPVTALTFLTVFVLTSTIIPIVLSLISTKSAMIHAIITLIVLTGLMIHYLRKLQENNKHLIG